MNYRRSTWLFCVGLGLAMVGSTLSAADNDGWTKLFDGKTLKGWEQKNGTAKYSVENGEILGQTSEGSPNSFLCSTKNYGDFELKFEVKVDDALNSGVQIRSASKTSKNNGRVHGPQVEIATNGTAGFIYGEALGTGWISSEESRADAKKQAALKKGQWNKYHVKADRQIDQDMDQRRAGRGCDRQHIQHAFGLHRPASSCHRQRYRAL